MSMGLGYHDDGWIGKSCGGWWKGCDGGVLLFFFNVVE